MAIDPRKFLVMTGHQSAEANPGFTRLYGTKAQQYVELNQFDIAPGAGTVSAGEEVSYTINIETRLVPDGYPSPVSPIPPVGPIKRNVVIKPIDHPLPGQFHGSDGSPVTPTKDASGQITGFTGTGTDGIQYGLAITHSTYNALGRDATPVQWYHATMAVSTGVDPASSDVANDPNSLKFGFSYCPWANLLELFVFRQNVQTMIRIDLAPMPSEIVLKAQPDLKPGMDAGRSISVDGFLYSMQVVTILDTQTDPGLYLPVHACFWPYLKGLAYFAPALGAMAVSTATGLAAPAVPIATFANLAVTFPIAQQAFVDQVIKAIAPALGPFLKSFLPTNEADAAPLLDAIMWLSSLSLQGIGEADLEHELVYFYTQCENWIREGKEGSGSFSAPIPHTQGLYWSEKYAQAHTSQGR